MQTAGHRNRSTCSKEAKLCTQLNMHSNSTLGKSSNSSNFGAGTHFGKRDFVRIKLSDKDLVLIAGIAVAAIIAVTTFLVDSNQSQKESLQQTKPGVNVPSALLLINKIGKSFIQERAQ